MNDNTIGKETVQDFIDCHKPDSIDVHYIEKNFGSVDAYMVYKAEAIGGDDGGWYIEVRGSDTNSGNPVIIEWE